MSEAGRLPAGVLDTCVVIDLRKIPDEALPMSAGVATVTLAELAMGVHLATDRFERSVRITRLISAEANFEPLPFDANAADAYGTLVAPGGRARPQSQATQVRPHDRSHGDGQWAASVHSRRRRLQDLESQLTVVPV